MIQLEIEKTNRGFAVCSFEDFYGEKCSIQDSSLADTAAIWLGIDDPKPKRLVQNEGWVEVELPPCVTTSKPAKGSTPATTPKGNRCLCWIIRR